MCIVWTVVWPSDKAAGLDGVRFMVLRWGHAVVWLLLAIAVFMAANPATQRFAQYAGWLALASYAAFLFVVVQAG